jgi:dTDP-glucose 4,6-dehydratase
MSGPTAPGRYVVAGAAGFIGFHLCRQLLAEGHAVVGIDNLATGSQRNVDDLLEVRGFTFFPADVCDPLAVEGPVTAVINLASPASPKDYARLPLETLLVGSAGVRSTLELARANDADYLLASTSEVYGEPLEHPQRETYWGNVNPVGPRSVYDESKRFAEATAAAYERVHGVRVHIARIFNTYGPRMRPYDGRVVSTLIVQALAGEPLTIYGDGTQTRSFCYVEDEVRGLLALVRSACRGPVNIGNPEERTVAELAQLVIALTGSSSPIVHEPLPVDDPTRRRPDISVARAQLGWAPEVPLEEGLRRTAAWFAHG